MDMKFKKGHTLNLGRKFPPEFKEKLRQVALSRSTSFQKGLIPWNKGTKGLMPSGEKSSAWKGGITNKNRLQRSVFRQTVQKDVFERDNYTCQLCGA